jgi:hypothetical protein
MGNVPESLTLYDINSATLRKKEKKKKDRKKISNTRNPRCS